MSPHRPQARAVCFGGASSIAASSSSKRKQVDQGASHLSSATSHSQNQSWEPLTGRIDPRWCMKRKAAVSVSPPHPSITKSSSQSSAENADPSESSSTNSGKSSTKMQRSTSERQPLSSRPQRGAAAKARFGFAANENNTQAAAASTSGGSTIKGAGVVIPRRRPAAASSASASVATEDDKVVAEAPMAEVETAVEEEAPVVLVSQIEEMATRAFEDGEGTELGELARGKLRLATSNKFDYKEKIAKRDECIKALRAALQQLLGSKDEFVKACVAVELSLRRDHAAARKRAKQADAYAAQAKSLEKELSALQVSSATAVAERDAAQGRLGVVEEELAAVKGECDGVKAELGASKAEAAALGTELSSVKEEGAKASQEVGELRAALEAARAELAGVKEAKAGLEAEVAGLKGELKEGQGRREAEAGERARVEGEAKALGEEVKALREQLSRKTEELAAARLEATQAAAAAQGEAIKQEGRLREEEGARAKAEGEVGVLKAKLEAAEAAAEEKGKELSKALASFADVQKAAAEREAETRKAGRENAERAAKAEARAGELEAELARLRAEASASSSELSAVKEELAGHRAELKAQQAAEQEGKKALAEATASLAVEKELRARAEQKEGEEREERVAANAQLLALQQAHAGEVENLRAEHAAAQREADVKLTDALKERDLLMKESREAQDAQLTMESELKTLKRALEEAKSQGEQLAELAQVSGEAEVLRRRLMEADRERQQGSVASMERITELEKQILEGEAQRRKMHNLIQELRGNVRVYARVRPYLPADGQEEQEHATINVNGHDDSLLIAKRDGKDKAKLLESHAFSFDKSFPPSAGQEAVFTEVSEFVQSALDGYNVCLFSYGQTGSGKTFTMQGSGFGPMKGIIPRAMEQVGQYKKQLEAQGWVYEMEVSFVEIYNEQVRDLLRSLNPDKTAVEEKDHDIKRDAKGDMFVQGVTLVAVDPNDADAVHKIMEVAGRHRAVGSTDMNARSSRSHSVFTLHLKARNAETRSQLAGKLNLCDLAGSERLSRSNATGDRLKETQAINKSLSALTDVFVAISNKQQHVPYRNSKLTYLLSPCLSGDGKTLMMVNLSPTQESYFESLCTLRFASQVNKCELGRPRRHMQVGGSSDGPAAAGSGAAGVSGASSSSTSSSRLMAGTASSSSRFGRPGK